MRRILPHVEWRAKGFAFFFADCRLSAKPSANVCGIATKPLSTADLQPVSVFRNLVAIRVQGMPGFNHLPKGFSIRATTFEEVSSTLNQQVDQSAGAFLFFHITYVSQHAAHEFLRQFFENISKIFLFIKLHLHRISIMHPGGHMIYIFMERCDQPVAIFFLNN
jgi:hypothetical protein